MEITVEMGTAVVGTTIMTVTRKTRTRGMDKGAATEMAIAAGMEMGTATGAAMGMTKRND